MVRLALSVIGTCLVFAGAVAEAQSDPPRVAPVDQERSRREGDEHSTSEKGKGGIGPGKKQVVLFPSSDYYPPNTASPHELGFSVQLLSFSNVGIADSGDSRFDLRLGGRFGLLRVASHASAERGWQVGIDAGFHGQFDNDHSQDNIGWDGHYGLSVTSALANRWALMLGVLHTSSHIGDELQERTGRRRIGYTREELRAGVGFRFSPLLRTYVEAGWGHELRNQDLQDPGRAQVGLVYEQPDGFFGGRFGWYAATDLSATEERDWRVDTAVQLGLLLISEGRVWRLGIAHYQGRPPMGEFFQATETYTAFGLYLDL